MGKLRGVNSDSSTTSRTKLSRSTSGRSRFISDLEALSRSRWSYPEVQLSMHYRSMTSSWFSGLIHHVGSNPFRLVVCKVERSL